MRRSVARSYGICAEWRGERFYTEPDGGSGKSVQPRGMDAFKVNVMPEVEEPAAPKQAINYATDLRPLGAWKATPMEAMSENWFRREPTGAMSVRLTVR